MDSPNLTLGGGDSKTFRHISLYFGMDSGRRCLSVTHTMCPLISKQEYIAPEWALTQLSCSHYCRPGWFHDVINQQPSQGTFYVLGEALGTTATKEKGRQLYSWAGFFRACRMQEYKHAFKLLLFLYFLSTELLLWWPSGKESACQVANVGSTPGSWRSPGEGNGNPLQYSCLEIS